MNSLGDWVRRNRRPIEAVAIVAGVVIWNVGIQVLKQKMDRKKSH